MYSRGFLKDLLEFINKRGTAALYQGLVPMLITLGTSNFVYFFSYNGLKRLILGPLYYKARMSTGTNLVLAAVAGAVNVFLTSPLWVANVRIKLQDRSTQQPVTSLWEMLMRIAQREGSKGLWSGLVPSLILVCNPTLQFVAYEKLKRVFFRLARLRGAKTPTAAEYFLFGALAKAFATVATYPVQLAQNKLRASDRDKNNGTTPQYRGTLDCILSLYKQGGFGALWKGLDTKLVQTILMAAFMFLTYEKISRNVLRMLGQK